jgi:hypothetical protein
VTPAPTTVTIATALACGLIVAVTPAAAAPRGEPAEEAAIRSQVGWGTTVTPDRVGVSTEGGWNGASGRAEIGATVEATLVPRASLFATAQVGHDPTARPTVGAAYQLIEPGRGATAARVTVAYKPEGFTEPEGEIEGVVLVAGRIGGGALRGRLAYGQDPEGRESDAEVGGSYLHAVGGGVLIGVSARYRGAIKVKTSAEPRWDLVSGGIVSYGRDRARVELLVGGDAVAYPGAAVQRGVIGLVSVGAEL